MKKRLNVLSVLMLLLMAAQVVMTFVTGADAFSKGWQEGAAGEIPVSTWSAIGEVFVTIAVMIAAIVSFCCFVNFILNINRNQVFEWGNVYMLRLTGIGLAVVVLLISAEEFFHGRGFTEVFEDYFDVLIFCVFNLIVAEAFAIGLKLKEEQALTI